jgi:hypothetical protein
MTLYLCAPAADRALFRTVISRADQILGYPRTHASGEPDVVIASGAPAPVTSAAFAVFVHDNTGAEILHGAVAAQVDGITSALRERFVEHNAVRKRIREWIADQGWELRATLPGVRSAWTRLAARDGAAGSATGVPIPEGQE